MTSSVVETKYQTPKGRDNVALATRRTTLFKNSRPSSSHLMRMTMLPCKLVGVIPILSSSNTIVTLDTSPPPTIHIQMLQPTQQQLHFCVQVRELVHARHQCDKNNTATTTTNTTNRGYATTFPNLGGVNQPKINTPLMLKAVKALNEKPTTSRYLGFDLKSKVTPFTQAKHVSQNIIVNNTTTLMKKNLNCNLNAFNCNSQQHQAWNAACQSCMRSGSYIFEDVHSGDYVCSKCGVCSDRVLLGQDTEMGNLNHDQENACSEQDQDQVGALDQDQVGVLDQDQDGVFVQDRRCTYGVIGERRKGCSSSSFPRPTPVATPPVTPQQHKVPSQQPSHQSQAGVYFNRVGLPKMVADVWAPSPEDCKRSPQDCTSPNERPTSRLNKRNHTQTTTTAASPALHYDRVAMTPDFPTSTFFCDATRDGSGADGADDGPPVEKKYETVVPDVDHTAIDCIAMDVDYDPYAPTWQKGVNGWFWSVGPGAPLNVHEN
eukprot:m.60412 g.60412  ORF g.60412 m.60412 type:complete len:489 (-) comp22833_c0_seq4:2641-4107(-)